MLNTIQRYPVIPVYYHDDKETCTEVLKACYAGGIRVFEFVDRGSRAKENFEALLRCKKAYFPGLKLGIGTIKTAERAKEFVELGAEFIVSPIVSAEIARETLDKGHLWIPGCMTPSEIALAERLGASLVKLFPGGTLGPQFLKAIKPLFPNLKFMPTGGVEAEESSIKGWFAAGVFAVGMGSKLFAGPDNTTGYDWLVERVSRVMGYERSFDS